MKKTIILFAILSLIGIDAQSQCSLDFGDNTIFNFPVDEIVSNTSTASDRTHTQSFDVWNTSGAGDCATTDGTDDISIQIDIIQTFDAYGGSIIDLESTNHDIEQNTSAMSGADGLKGTIPLGGASTRETSPGDVRGYRIKVEFANSVFLSADRVTVDYSSINTKGKAYESSLISFLDDSGNYFTAPPSYEGFYDSGAVESAVCNTTPVINPSPWGTLGIGHFSAHSTGTVNITNTCITTGTGGANGTNNTGTVAATSTGIAAGTRIGGFEFMVYLEDVASAVTEATESQTVTSFTSTLKGITITGPTPLPVELLNFDAKQNESEVALTWSTATELNNDYFTIETSPNGRDFSELGRVQGAGNSLETQQYNYIHNNPLTGFNYYRLKQTDYDGQFSYSPIVIVKIEENYTLKIYPTIVKHELNIELSNKSEKQIPVSIYNINGSEIKTMVIDPTNGLSTFDTQDLKEGYYFLSTFIGGKKETYKFIKL